MTFLTHYPDCMRTQCFAHRWHHVSIDTKRARLGRTALESSIHRCSISPTQNGEIGCLILRKDYKVNTGRQLSHIARQSGVGLMIISRSLQVSCKC